MKHIIFSLMMLAATTAYADNTLIVEHIDDASAGQYQLSDIQKIVLKDANNITIVNKDSSTVELKGTKSLALNFTGISTAITVPETAVEAAGIRVWASGDAVYVAGAKVGEPIAVFTLGGGLIARSTVTAATTRVDVSSLPTGAYVVKAGKKAAKFIKK